MKMTLLGLLILITMKISANEKWIPLNSTDKTQTTNIDINLSQIEPINKMLQNAMVVKKLIDATNKQDIPVANDKNWFKLE